MVAVVLAPVPADDAVLLLQLGVHRGPRHRGEDQVLEGVQIDAPGEGHRVPDNLVVVLLGAEDKHAVDLDAEFVEIDDAFLDGVQVLGLVVGLEGGGVDGFQAHKDHVAAARAMRSRSSESRAASTRTWALHSILMFSRRRRSHSSLMRWRLAVKLSSQKKMCLAREALTLISSMIRSTLQLRYLRPNIMITEQKLQLKGQPREVAMETLLAFGPPLMDQLVIRDGQAVQVLQKGAPGVLTDLAVFPVADIGHLAEIAVAFDGLDQFRQGLIPLAADHVVGMLEAFLRQEARVRPSQDHGNALLPVCIGQGVGPGGRGGNG